MIDSTPRDASSATSAPSATPVPTPPSSRLRESRRRRTRSSTSARCVHFIYDSDRNGSMRGIQRVAFVYRAKRKIEGSNVRVIWGCVYTLFIWSLLLNKKQLLFRRRVTRSHGNSGVVKSKFTSNIPPHAFGASVRVVSRSSMTMHRFLSSCTIRCSTPQGSNRCILSLAFVAFSLPIANMTCLHATHVTLLLCMESPRGPARVGIDVQQ